MNLTDPRVALVVAVLLGVVFGYRGCSKPKAIPNPFASHSRAHEPYAAFVKRMANNPDLSAKFNARIRASADPKSVGFEIAERGMRRLDAASLEQRMMFALKLVEFMDVPTCAALARPGAERNRQMQPQILKAIEQMPATDIEGYLALVERAIVAELDNVAVPPLYPGRAEAALQNLASRFSDAERAVLMRVINYPSTTTHDTACWMVRTVFSETLALPVGDRQTLARLFSEPAQ